MMGLLSKAKSAVSSAAKKLKSAAKQTAKSVSKAASKVKETAKKAAAKAKETAKKAAAKVKQSAKKALAKAKDIAKKTAAKLKNALTSPTTSKPPSSPPPKKGDPAGAKNGQPLTPSSAGTQRSPNATSPKPPGAAAASLGSYSATQTVKDAVAACPAEQPVPKVVCAIRSVSFELTERRGLNRKFQQWPDSRDKMSSKPFTLPAKIQVLAPPPRLASLKPGVRELSVKVAGDGPCSMPAHAGAGWQGPDHRVPTARTLTLPLSCGPSDQFLLPQLVTAATGGPAGDLYSLIEHVLRVGHIVAMAPVRSTITVQSCGLPSIPTSRVAATSLNTALEVFPAGKYTLAFFYSFAVAKPPRKTAELPGDESFIGMDREQRVQQQGDDSDDSSRRARGHAGVQLDFECDGQKTNVPLDAQRLVKQWEAIKDLLQNLQTIVSHLPKAGFYVDWDWLEPEVGIECELELVEADWRVGRRANVAVSLEKVGGRFAVNFGVDAWAMEARIELSIELSFGGKLDVWSYDELSKGNAARLKGKVEGSARVFFGGRAEVNLIVVQVEATIGAEWQIDVGMGFHERLASDGPCFWWRSGDLSFVVRYGGGREVYQEEEQSSTEFTLLDGMDSPKLIMGFGGGGGGGR